MAKKAQEENLSKKIIKKYGNVVYDVSAILEKPQIIIPTTPRLDIALGGGIPVGTWFVITGPEKLGKSTLALTFAANAQKEEYGKRKIYFAAVEQRLKKRDVLGIQGLDLDPTRFQVISSVKGNILSAEDYCEIFDDILTNEEDIVLIIDSIGGLVTKNELTATMNDQQRADCAKLLAKLVRKNISSVSVNNNTVVAITQQMANPSGMGNPIQDGGGKKIAYQLDTKVRGKGTPEKWIEGDKIIGQKVNWQVTTSALGSPNQEMTTFLRYGIGMDYVAEVTELAEEVGLIEISGAWFTIGSTGEKFQGRAKLVDHIRNSPELYEQLYKDTRKCFLEV